MFKSILLAVDSSRYSEVCTRYALEYAKLLGAKITGLSVLDRKEIAIVYPYYYPTADFPPVFDETVLENSELFERQKQRADEVLRRVEEDCRKMEIPCVCEIRDGLVPEVILEEAQSADLLFAGQRGAGAEYTKGLLGSNLENVVRRSSIPIIITPHIYRTLQHILVCFDGSEYSIRALRAAVHLAAACPKGCVTLRLLVVHDNEEAAQQIAGKAVKYLQAYDMKEIFLHRQGDPADQIIECAQSENIDLVAMGAYGHSRIRELMLGSTTETILRHVSRAVLLHH
ncbi:MAG TPA: universal stress protein [bacterium]|nr:universal stress protein [bacterium]